MAIRIGVLSTLFGPFTELGRDGVRGVEMAVAEFNGRVSGKPIELIVEGTVGDPEGALSKTRKLIDKDKVDFIVGPLSGNEGLAIRQFALEHPDITFVNGTSGAQNLTHDVPNLFNFVVNGVQCVAGLGKYAYETLGFRRVVTLAENYSYPHAQIGGFMLEFCRAGGRVVNKFWVPLMTSDYREIINTLPGDIDAILVALGGSDAIHFLQQYYDAGHKTPILSGAITADQSVLSHRDLALDYLVGVISGGITADDDPAPHWQKFVSTYQQMYSDRFNFPSYFALGYYANTKAALLGLEAIGGDLSGKQSRFQQALARVEFDGPCGHIKLDHHHQAITDTFVVVVEKDTDGTFYRKLVKRVENVNYTLGLSEEEYDAMGMFTQDNPSCP